MHSCHLKIKCNEKYDKGQSYHLWPSKLPLQYYTDHWILDDGVFLELIETIFLNRLQIGQVSFTASVYFSESYSLDVS